MSTGGQRTEWRRNITENVNRLSSTNVTYRQTTDRRQTYDRRTNDDIANVNVSSRSSSSLSFYFAQQYKIAVTNISTYSKQNSKALAERQRNAHSLIQMSETRHTYTFHRPIHNVKNKHTRNKNTQEKK